MNKSKLFLGVLLSGIIISCGSSIESDAQKAGQLMCEANKNPSKLVELSAEVSKISEKYVGDESTKFKELAEKEYEKCLYDDTDDSSSSTSEISNDNNTEDIDAMLDSYESYVDEYISYMKKINSGDMSAYSDMSTIMSQAEDLGNKMEKTKGNMTPEQLSRMNEIITKMNKAVSEMK